MSYYLVFEKDTDEFRGYTTEKEMIDTLMEQRKGINKFRIEKVKNSFFDEEGKKMLKTSATGMFDYYGVVLFPDEEDHIHMQTYGLYKEFINTLQSYLAKIAMIKFSENELEIVSKFTDLALVLELNYQDSFESDEAPFDEESFNVKELVLHVLRKSYKKGKFVCI